LALAIICEIAATLSLRASEGFSKPLFVLIVVLGYVASFSLLGIALKHGIPLAVAYAIWSGVGICAVTALSGPLFDESLSLLQLGGIGLVLAGAITVEMGGAT